MQTLTFRAMGCTMLAALDAAPAQAIPALAQVPGWFRTWERHLSRFRSESELNRLNRRPGRATPVSPVLWAATRAALWGARATGGLVTPTVLAAVRAAGYDRSFEHLVAEQPVAALPAVPAPAWQAIRMDAPRRQVQLPPGTGLDLAGTTKGWAATRAARRLARYGPALVDAGGDIALAGPVPPDGWPVGVADPFDPARQVALLVLTSEGVATSGRDYRRWSRGGVPQHHLIDPRTGQPADTDLLTVTIVAPETLAAEAAAKAVLILGARAGLAWIEARPHLAALLITARGDVLLSSRMPIYMM